VEKTNSKQQTIIMFILIILRDVSFLLSSKGNKGTKSPATTIIHRVCEEPLRNYYYMRTPSDSPSHPPTHFHPLSYSSGQLFTHLQSYKHTSGSQRQESGLRSPSRVRNHSTRWQVAAEWSSGAFVLWFICI